MQIKYNNSILSAYLGDLTVQQIDELIERSTSRIPVRTFRRKDELKKTPASRKQVHPKPAPQQSPYASYNMPDCGKGYLKAKDFDPL